MDAEYWDFRYQRNETGWDIGYASPALIKYITSKANKSTSILIPGAGKAYEVEELHRLGYQVWAADLSETAKQQFLDRVSTFPEERYIIGDFFELECKFDIILEQTFFCALDPKLRSKYVRKMHSLLAQEGLLAGLLFNFEKKDGPPFGGSEAEYLAQFSTHFDVLTLEECYNSIVPRQASEYFFELRKKSIL